MITGDVKGSGEDYEKMGKMWPDEKQQQLPASENCCCVEMWMQCDESVPFFKKCQK